MKKLILAGTALILLTGCEGLSRTVKTVQSDFTGGLERVVTVYSYDGEPIQSWEGKFDIQRRDDGVVFDINGKRVIVKGGIIVSEEK